MVLKTLAKLSSVESVKGEEARRNKREREQIKRYIDGEVGKKK